MTGKPLRTVIVGFGQIADGLRHDARMAEYFTYATHAQVLDDHPGIEWLGVVDPRAEALAEATNAWKVPHVSASLSEVAEAVEPELAVIAAPPGHRAEIVQQLPSLKAVMVEKPLGHGGEEGQAFVDFCAKRKIPVQVNYWRRGDRLYRELTEGGLEARIGKPQAVFATYGNGLYNNAGHLVDFIHMLLGDVAAVQALGDARVIDELPIEGDVTAPFALTLASGPIVTVLPLDFRHYREIGLDIWGETGRLALYQESLGVFHYPLAENRGLDGESEIASDNPNGLEPTVGDALFRLYDNLLDAAHAGKADGLWSPGHQAMQAERILDAVVDSAAESGGRFYFQ